MNALFEGNQQILNIYSETTKPQTFFMYAAITIVSLTILIACTVGYVGYLAFGSASKSVIIFNLPPHDTASIITKLFYIITIMGSFVLVI